MVETVVVLFFLCIVFFWVYEYTGLLTRHTVLDYAAARAARARTVGFNDFMITKTVRVATMSTAGACMTKDDEGNGLSTATLVSRMGSYLQAANEAETSGILDFKYWDGAHLGWTCSEPGGDVNEITMRVWQRRPLYGSGADDEAADSANRREPTLAGEARIEGHYQFYLQ
jgi:Flp pilus assembly protein TadG